MRNCARLSPSELRLNCLCASHLAFTNEQPQPSRSFYQPGRHAQRLLKITARITTKSTL